MTASDPTASGTTAHGGPRRSALVTGASAGIGAAFAEALAREQYDLVLVARRADRLEELAKRLRDARGVAIEVLAADLTDGAGLARVVARVEEGPPDLLVNNAGHGSFGNFAELDIDREVGEIQLNVVALVRLTRAALPGMIRRGHGAIINVSSMAGFQPMPFNATYGATKAFVNSFTEALHEELRGTGVRVQALCPGFTRTDRVPGHRRGGALRGALLRVDGGGRGGGSFPPGAGAGRPDLRARRREPPDVEPAAVHAPRTHPASDGASQPAGPARLIP